MRFTKVIAVAAALSTFGISASAGGLAPPVMGDVVVVDTPPPPSGSINSGYVVLGLLAALVAASGSF